MSEQKETTYPIKEWLVDYVGTKNQPEDERVTVEMIVETMATEFPEFLLAVAEENWVRGYQQALSDVSEGEKLVYEQLPQTTEDNVAVNFLETEEESEDLDECGA